jgi:glycosyltransferase involved in cell wall biosynthesis
MQKKYGVYLWEPETSPHKLPLFRELLVHNRISSAKFIAQGELNEHRRLEGWQTDLCGDASVMVAPTGKEIDSIVANSPKDSIHIFSGIHWVPCIVDGLRAVVRYNRRFGILHEPRVFEGMGGLARLAHSWLTEASLRQNASFVLAIGAHGPKWFRMAGYGKDRIFPFAYFLPMRPPTSDASFEIKSSAPVVSFLGRLEKLKGIHLFLDAIEHLKNEANFYIAGHGTCAPLVEHAQRDHSNVNFLGPIKMAEVPNFLSKTDILVLPSITMDDGWGAVVSEAMMAGAAVVSSYKVGASMCLADEVRGTVVRRLAGPEIAVATDRIITRGLCADTYRNIRSQWADEHLTQRIGAEYLVNIFDHLFDGQPRPASFVLSQLPVQK